LPECEKAKLPQPEESQLFPACCEIQNSLSYPISLARAHVDPASRFHLSQAGAKHVYGIECSAIADQAKQIIEDNGYSDKITILKAKVMLANYLGLRKNGEK